MALTAGDGTSKVVTGKGMAILEDMSEEISMSFLTRYVTLGLISKGVAFV